jgi:osmoprotectant transport system substrate-binding protein
VRIPARAVWAALLIGLTGILTACGTGKPDAASSQGSVPARSTLPGQGKPPLTIGDKNFTEQFVIGELYAQALTSQGYSVLLNRNIGPLEVTIQALRSGRLDMYPEYAGIWNEQVAGQKRTFKTARAALLAARRYARQHGFAVLDATPFSNTSAIAVTVAYAAAHQLKTLRDLGAVAGTMTLGAPPQFQQSTPGLALLEQDYGFVPAAFKPLVIGSQYQALDQGIVQAAEVSTTDGQLVSGNYKLLADPDRIFGWGEVIPILPRRVLLAEGPAFAATIDQVNRLLTLSAIRRLNAAVDIHNQDPATVAKQFLQAHGLLRTSGS